MLAFLIFCTTFFVSGIPKIPLWTGTALATLVTIYIVLPPMRGGIGTILRVYPAWPLRRALKLMLLGASGGVLIFMGVTGTSIKKDMLAREAQRVASEKERMHKVEEANSNVADLVSQAKDYLTAGKATEAITLLGQAEKIPMADKLDEVRELSRRLALSSNSTSVRELLISMPDNEFSEFRLSGKISQSLNMGFPVLTDRVVTLAKPKIAAVLPIHEERRRKREADAAEQKEREFAEAEARRKEAIARAAVEKVEREDRQRDLKDKLDTYSKLLESAGVDVVRNIKVSRSNDLWTATLTVKDIWHYKHKQIRLQDAQTLWKVLASIASPRDLDKARISIVDGNDNEVGGSRILGGSLLWVQD